MAQPQQRQVQGCDWNACRSEWLDWDDGHVPENLRTLAAANNTNNNNNSTKLVRDPNLHSADQVDISVVDHAVHSSLVEALYDATIQQEQPWGTYVSLEEAKEEWEQFLPDNYDPERDSKIILPSSTSSQSQLEHLSRKLVAAYLHRVLQINPDGLKEAHGVAVWALASDVGSEVPYHLDYAEQLRYESNIIVPPLWAGTLHCTLAAVQGGHFRVHTGGLEHYKRHGYKGRLQSLQDDDQQDDETSTLYCNETRHFHFDYKIDNDSHHDHHHWIDIPFCGNRMIVTSGHLPHLSTPVTKCATAQHRVIVGLNVFRHDIGPFVQRAPEHSPAFRRRVALHRATTQRPQLLLSVQAVQSNPVLRKLLVQAKRQKENQDFVRAQDRLNENINRVLLSEKQTSTAKLQDLMHLFGTNSDGSWPNAVDVQVHVSRECRQGRWKVVESSKKNVKIIPPDCHITLVDATVNNNNSDQ